MIKFDNTGKDPRIQANRIHQTGGEQQQKGKDPKGQIPIGPVKPPILPQPEPFEPLTADQLKQVAGVGGAGIRGSGTLEGKIAIRQTTGPRGAVDAPILITAHEHTRSEVSFTLDMPLDRARQLEGRQAAVEGNITKTGQWAGRIEGAKLAEDRGYANGAFATVSGRTVHRQPVAIGGETAPAGIYLELDQPVTVGGEPFSAAYMGPRFGEGQRGEFHGKLVTRDIRGPLSDAMDRNYLMLSGVSNVTAGEPIFDGDGFETAAGKQAPMYTLDQRSIRDAPDIVMVLDQGSDRAFVGAFGGFINPQVSSPFHGFIDSAAIQQPTDADRAAVRADPETGHLVNAQGEKLKRLGGDRTPPGSSDPMTRTWYLDESANTAYRIANGGIAGFGNHMEQVVRLPL